MSVRLNGVHCWYCLSEPAEPCEACDEVNAILAVSRPDEALVVQPGDTLIVRVAMIQQDHAFALKAALKERLPGVEVIAIGADQLAIYRPGEQVPS